MCLRHILHTADFGALGFGVEVRLHLSFCLGQLVAGCEVLDDDAAIFFERSDEGFTWRVVGEALERR